MRKDYVVSASLNFNFENCVDRNEIAFFSKFFRKIEYYILNNRNAESFNQMEQG